MIYVHLALLTLLVLYYSLQSNQPSSKQLKYLVTSVDIGLEREALVSISLTGKFIVLL
jgi:hypothetical protein